MLEKEFINLYWKQYLMIEKELKQSIKYVAIDKDNYNCYSDAYAKLLLQIGSEVDVVFKQLCLEIDNNTSANRIDEYREVVINRFPEFESVSVICEEIILKPWANFISKTPDWWRIYNGVKHNRNAIQDYDGVLKENYKFANQGVVLKALAGLYQEEQYLFSLIRSEESPDTPLPGSRLFKLIGDEWEGKSFIKDLGFVDRGGGNIVVFQAELSYNDV